jgi:hypothetical protein
MLPAGGDGAPLPTARPAAGVWKARPPGGPPRHIRVVCRPVEAGPATVPPKNATLVTVISARAVTVPPGLLSAVSVPLTKPGHFLPPCG